MVTYHYWRYLVPKTEEIAILDKALERASSDIEGNDAYPDKIVLEDGSELDHDAILRLLNE